MDTPGIDVRPLRQITGHAHFNEVFLTDVRIPHDQVIGQVHGGWAPIAERSLVSVVMIGGGGGFITWTELREAAVDLGGTVDATHRQELMQAYTRYEILRFLGYRTQTALSRGVAPGPESSVMKLIMSEHISRTSDLLLAMQGAAGGLTDDWSHLFLNQWTVKIGGGTDQVQRNVIGERVLGLPGEARVDKDVPFRDLATSTTTNRTTTNQPTREGAR